MPHASKTKIRNQIREQRRALSSQQQQKAASQLCEQIIHQEFFNSSQHIAFYMAHDGEMDPSQLMSIAWQQGKTCYLPVITDFEDRKLHFVEHQKGGALHFNQFGIAEPEFNKEKSLTADQLDLVFMPLVAFDLKGNRLGMGGGYYDRTFTFIEAANDKPLLVALAHEFQHLDEIPAEHHDVNVHVIATEQNLFVV